MAENSLPSFGNPPVVETVLGFQFDPIGGLCSGHLGAFWKTLGDEWNKVEDAAPLEPFQEPASEEQKWILPGLASLRISDQPVVRLRIWNRSLDRMIQVQNGRFLLNWIGTGGSTYPRYERLRPQFLDLFTSFRDFVASSVAADSTPQVVVNHWEVTYVNHLPLNLASEALSDTVALITPRLAPPPNFGPAETRTFGGQWACALRDHAGRLYIELRHGRQDSKPDVESQILTLKLTARGPTPAETSLPGPELTIDVGRAAIVQAFSSVTSEEVHRKWDRQY
jgi:uncharacterized protein (TIGR04255 family)